MRVPPSARLRRLLAVAAVVPAVLAAAACGGGSGGSSTAASSGSGAKAAGGTVALVAYSTPQKVYEKLIPAFQKTAAGTGSTFQQSFGASGAQSRAVIAGQPADVVEFSTEPDMTKLVQAGLVAKD